MRSFSILEAKKRENCCAMLVVQSQVGDSFSFLTVEQTINKMKKLIWIHFGSFSIISILINYMPSKSHMIVLFNILVPGQLWRSFQRDKNRKNGSWPNLYLLILNPPQLCSMQNMDSKSTKDDDNILKSG